MGENVTTLYGSTTGPSLHQNIALVKSLLMNFVMNKMFFKNNIKMNKNILLAFLFVPVIAFGAESRKEEVIRKRNRLNAETKQQATMMSKKILQKAREIDERLVMAGHKCREKDCAEGLAGLRVMLSIMATGKMPKDIELNPALKDAFEKNADRITPESLIVKPLSNDLGTLTMAKTIFGEKDDSDAKLSRDQANFVDVFVDDIVDLGNDNKLGTTIDRMAKAESLEVFGKKLGEKVQNLVLPDVTWSEISAEEQKKIEKTFLKMWMLAPEVYSAEMKKLEASPSLADGVRKGVEYLQDSEDALKMVNTHLKTLGVDPDKDTVDKSKDGKKDGGLFGRK